MAQDPDADASPLRRRRNGTTATQAGLASPPVPAPASAPPEPEAPTAPVPPASTSSVDDEFLGRPARRRRISRRYLATIGAGSLIVATIVGLAASYAVAKGTHRYQSLALVEIDQPLAIAASPDDGVVAKLSRLRYKYAGLMRTETFAAP